MTHITHKDAPPGKVGLVMHAAALYDVVVWLLTLGREPAFREKLLQFARLQPGETVLDVGCGTGSLAIAAKRQVGAIGRVYGIDASPEMIARAAKKARKIGVEIAFKNSPAQKLPFPNAQFDAVLSTMMLHHLPRKGREDCAREISRVLKPGGRVLAVDFGVPGREHGGFLAHFHRHGHVALTDMVGFFSDAGLKIVESGPVEWRNLQFVLATAPVTQEIASIQTKDSKP
jgi:ubiquinone/menaquinone biosynthesis C-methylase UbiE